MFAGPGGSSVVLFTVAVIFSNVRGIYFDLKHKRKNFVSEENTLKKNSKVIKTAMVVIYPPLNSMFQRI